MSDSSPKVSHFKVTPEVYEALKAHVAETPPYEEAYLLREMLVAYLKEKTGFEPTANIHPRRGKRPKK